MAVLEESCSGAGDDGSDRQRCSCLPFCFWGGDSSGGWADESGGAPAKRRRWRRRRRLRLTWLAWPWSFFRKGGENKDAGGCGDGRDKGRKKKKKWRGRRLLLLLTASLQPKKALESVVSGDGALLPAKVSSFGDAKKKSNRKATRPTADDDGWSSGSSRQPQASTTTASTRWTSTAPARSRPETTIPGGPTGGGTSVAAAGRIWRAPSRRHTFHDLDGADRPGGGLWTAATTLGVIVLFGRVTAVVFLCSCLYGARFVRVRLGGRAKAKAKSSGGAGGSLSSGRWSGDPAGVVAAEKKVVVAEHQCEKKVGFIDRAGKTPSSRFGR
nr:unnamed protein product [Digitaria exilis]